MKRCALLLLSFGCAPVARAPAAPYTPASASAAARTGGPAVAREQMETGFATWYGDRLAGHSTASGERFDPNQLTAAHRTLPLGTWIEVRRAGTARVVRVKINDRGPFGYPDRIIDLARAAFERLGRLKEGVIPVEVRVIAAP